MCDVKLRLEQCLKSTIDDKNHKIYEFTKS